MQLLFAGLNENTPELARWLATQARRIETLGVGGGTLGRLPRSIESIEAMTVELGVKIALRKIFSFRYIT